MKAVIFGLVTLAIAAPTLAADSGLTATQAQQAVQREAHTFISKNAPDFGGYVHSPCAVKLSGDRYTVTCSGVADETTGGDGDVRISFKCVGNFDQGHDGLFSLDGSIHCR